MRHTGAVIAVLVSCSTVAATTMQARQSAAGSARVSSPESRAVAFLAIEVPRWRREHPCYSCHNNGDAARALLTAARHGHALGDALDDTLAWLRDPKRWNDKMPKGGVDDKPLARIQFAGALMLAVRNVHADRAVLIEAAQLVAADQRADGSWQLDSSQSLGSPTTYGTTLATSSALRVLRSADAAAFLPAITKGSAWLRASKIETVLDAAGALLGLDPSEVAVREQRAHCLDVIARGQAPNGGWGPYLTSPPDVFDTALVMLALKETATADLTPALARARAFLIAEQFDDGSWPATTRPAGQESYAQRISTTGWALLALLETQ
jgi:hypothetical protein